MPESLRIVQVAPFYEPVKGGVEEVVRKISEYMASRGHEIHVVTYNRLRAGGVGSLPKDEVINGVHVVRLRPRLTWSHGSYSPELPEVLRGLRPDVVHVHVWRHPHAFQVTMLKKEAGFKAVLHGHSPFHRLSQLGPAVWVYHRLADAVARGYLRSFDAYVALTRHEAAKVKSLGVEEDKVKVIPNGVERDECGASLDSKVEGQVLYLGRVSRAKNLPLLLKAIRLASRELRGLRLVVAGPDEGLARGLIEYSRRHGIRVEYLGEVSEADKHRLYSESEAYALPSLYEPFGIALLEAGAHMTPSVITGDGGQLEAAPPGVASLWAEPRPEAYSEALVRLLTDGDLRRRLAEGARKVAEAHEWGKILPRYDELYRALAG